MIKVPELLAPVGGPEQLKAAVENGADAVYMGGSLFNARMNAGNFTEETMKEAVEYAHMRGTEVHVTMNTLLEDREMEAAVKQAAEIWEMGADAFIIQDLGFAALLHKHFPEMTLHMSTQGTVYNAEGVAKAAELGFSRVVLAREVSLEEIRRITAQTDTEIEVFIHGALCMCYSGQCQMSRVIGGRSGNRGMCAQPCRLGYELYRERGENGRPPAVGAKSQLQSHSKTESHSKLESELEYLGNGFLLSPKDICTIDYLGELTEAGVASLKIEGRMKSPEYVAVVTGIYRKYLDEYARSGAYRVSEEDRRTLNQIFSRGAFTTGYLLGNPRRELLSGDLPKHQGVKIGSVISSNPGRRTVKAKLTAPLSIGDGVEIRSRELTGNVITYIKGNEIGYLKGKIAPGDEIYKITDKALMEKARASYEGKSGTEQKQLRKRDVTMELRIRVGEPAVLTVRDAQTELGHVQPDNSRNQDCKQKRSQFEERDQNEESCRNLAGQTEPAGPCVTVRSEECAEPAVNRPLDRAAAEKQLDKTGGTPFRLKRLELDLGDVPASIRLSVLNELRRNALAQFEEALRAEAEQGRVIEKSRLRQALLSVRPRAAELKQNSPLTSPSAKQKQTTAQNKPLLSYYLFRADEEMLKLAQTEEREVPGAGRLPLGRCYLPYELFFLDEYAEPLQRLREAGRETVPFLPAVTRGREDEILKANEKELTGLALNYGISVGNLWQAEPFVKAGARVYGDFGLNAYNSSDVALAKELGLSGIALSCETLRETESGSPFDYAAIAEAAAVSGIETEAAAGGWIPLMISAHCPIGDAGKGCGGCHAPGTDRLNGEKDILDMKKCLSDQSNGVCGLGGCYLKDRKNQFYTILTRKTDCQVLIFRKKEIIAREIAGRIGSTGVLNLRYYGIDKKIFCGQPST